MALQVVSTAVSVYKVTGVKDGQQQSEEHTFRRGEILPDWVDTHQQFTLTTTGMARQVGDFPDPNLRAVEDMPAPVVLPEHSPRGVIGSRITEPMLVTRQVGAGASAAPAASRAEGELPADSDTKPEWEKAAVELGVPRSEAESMRKADLVKEVKARQAKATKEQEERDLGGDDTKLPKTFATGGQVPPASPKSGPAPKAGA